MAEEAAKEVEVPEQFKEMVAMFTPMFDQFSQGKGTVTLAEAAEVARMMLAEKLFPQIEPLLAEDNKTMEEHVGKTHNGEMVAGIAGQVGLGPDDYFPLAKLFANNLKVNLVNDMEALLAGPFKIVDSDGSDAVTKKEFLGILLMALCVQKMYALKGTHDEATEKATAFAFIDAVYLTMDADDSGSISKDEIKQYVYNITTGAADVVKAVIGIVQKSIPDELYAFAAKTAFSFAEEKGGLVTDGKVLFKTMEPFLAMMDQTLTNARAKVTEEGREQFAALQMAKQMEHAFYKQLESVAEEDTITKEKFSTLYAKFMDEMRPQIKKNALGLIPGELMQQVPPPAAMFIPMVPQVMADVMTAEAMSNTLDASFDIFGKADADGNQTIELSKLKGILQTFYGAFEGEEEISAEVRLKTLFQLVDEDCDNGVSEKEAALMLKKLVAILFAGMGDVVGIYGALFGNKTLWTEAIDTGLKMFVPQVPEQFRPTMPLDKKWFYTLTAAAEAREAELDIQRI